MHTGARKAAKAIHKATQGDPGALAILELKKQLHDISGVINSQQDIIQQAMVDTVHMLKFNELLCGILYTAIVRDTRPASPCQEIVGGSLLTGGAASLHYLREGIRLWCLDVCDAEKGPKVAYNNAVQYYGGNKE